MKTLTRYGTVLRLFDNGGKTCDRYTIIPPRWAGPDYRERNLDWVALGSSERPFHPQGLGQHVTATPGPHLGRRVTWADLPTDVQRFARQSFPEFAPGSETPPSVRLIPERIEAPAPRNGRPGYRWVPGYYVTGADGNRIYPPVRRREAIALARSLYGPRVRILFD